jgi:hypothetical protein
MIEEKEIVGKLLAGGEAFDMLDLYPYRHTGFASPIPFVLREHIFEFLVVVKGFAQTIMVSRSNFVIIPYLVPKIEEVEYSVEGEKEEELDESKDPTSFVA